MNFPLLQHYKLKLCAVEWYKKRIGRLTLQTAPFAQLFDTHSFISINEIRNHITVNTQAPTDVFDICRRTCSTVFIKNKAIELQRAIVRELLSI